LFVEPAALAGLAVRRFADDSKVDRQREDEQVRVASCMRAPLTVFAQSDEQRQWKTAFAKHLKDGAASGGFEW
jgi:hypothetical protein